MARPGKHWGKNTVIVAALLAAGFFAAWLRFRPYLGTHGSYTDGSFTYSELPQGELRYALWEGAEPLAGPVNSEAAESRPTISPDGRWLVFAVGERGLNADLWIAELGADGAEPGEPRPLTELNTGADELAPAFGPDALYFATERPGGAGGLDLWSAPYRGGAFEPAEPLHGDVNTVDDETDPAPRPGSREVFFASDRRPEDARGIAARRDTNLWLARPSASSDPVPPEATVDAGDEEALRWTVASLGELNTPFDEREPAFTADGRHLFFASDRDGGTGGFDLYRSARSGLDWSPADALAGINSEGDERAPAPQADGFALWFAGAEGGAPPDLWRARSVELFHIPGRPVGWWDLVILGALLVLALLAWLARHWESIDVLYRCFLISLLAHFLLMLWMQRVHPESEVMELPGRDALFTVRLASNASSASGGRSERAGELELERQSDQAAEQPARLAALTASATLSDAQAPERFELTTDESAAAPAPAAEAVELARAEATPAPAAEVETPAESFERADGAAPEVALAAAELALDASDGQSALAAATPSRTATQSASEALTGEVAPAAGAELAAAEAQPASAPVRTEVALEQASRSASETAVAIATPTEERQRLDGAAPTLAVAAATGAAPTERTSTSTAAEAARRTSSDLGLAPSQPATAAPLTAALSTAAAETGAAPTRQASLPERGAPRAVDAPTRLPSEATASERGAGATPAPAVALTPAALGAVAATHSSAPELTRSTGSPAPPNTASSAAPTHTPGAALQADVATPASAPVPASSGALAAATLEPRRVGPSEPTLRAPAPPPDPQRASSDAALTPRPLALTPTGLAARATAPGRFTPSSSAPASTAPARRALPAAPVPALDDRAPAALALEAAAPTATAASDVGPRSDVEHTPYRARFGPEKQRALEVYGGGEETERAVAAGLEYLAGIQGAKGNWGSPRDRDEKYGHVAVGKTGLCLLAFLAAGHTPESETRYSGVADRAVDFLLSMQTKRKGHFGDTTSYSHGIATYALAECYALTRDKRLEAPLKRAVHHILSEQEREGGDRFEGGWGYYYADNSEYDPWPRASVTAWQVMALESARIGGIPVPDSTFEAARGFLDGLWDRRRRAFRYSHDPGRLNSDYPVLPGSTPASLFALSLLGADVSSRHYRQAVDFVLDRSPEEYRYRGDDAFVFEARGNLYFWYYSTLAMFRIGGDRWQRWNAAMKETLLPAQEPNGSWMPISIYAQYAGDDNRDRSYSTAMCVLTLEVYYRYFTPLLSVESR